MIAPPAQRRSTPYGPRALSPAVLRGLQAAVLGGLLLAAATGISWWQLPGGSPQWEYAITFSTGEWREGARQEACSAAEALSAGPRATADQARSRGWTLRIAATGGAVLAAVQCSYERNLRRDIGAANVRAEITRPAPLWAALAWLLTLVACIRWSTRRRCINLRRPGNG